MFSPNVVQEDVYKWIAKGEWLVCELRLVDSGQFAIVITEKHGLNTAEYLEGIEELFYKGSGVWVVSHPRNWNCFKSDIVTIISDMLTKEGYEAITS